jgi:hypothetical protein
VRLPSPSSITSSRTTAVQSLASTLSRAAGMCPRRLD